jgi:L,D-peptidoglycan transpeptidase YkuD (ErfK/YbiS/YcfS/YnhG family)
MKVKNTLKYIILLLCLLLIGCSGNGKFKSEQVKLQDSTIGDTTTEESTTEESTTEESTTGIIESKDVTLEETKKESDIENENSAENYSESNKSTNTKSNDEQVAIISTDNQQTPESGENLETIIMVYKADRRLELWQDGKMISQYHIGLGKEAEGKKEIEGDKKTPEGEYYVCTMNQYSKFYLALGVSYPNIEDAKNGLENGLIDEDTYSSIETAIQNGQCPPWNTSLGGEIMIHGHGGSKDWTKGCIGVDDDVMDVLWEACSIGTKIIINP